MPLKYPISNKTLQENHYYPFGLRHHAYAPFIRTVRIRQFTEKEIRQIPPEAVVYKYKYNGKELQDELGLNWYDYGSRIYDPVTARWYSVDVFSEKYYSNSNYVYTLNNPVIFIDPDGNVVEMCCDKLKGFIVGVADNLLGTNFRQSVSVENVAAFNSGLDTADAISFTAGTLMTFDGTKNIAAGTLAMSSGVTLTAETGGLSIEVSGAEAAAGALLTAEGVSETYIGHTLYSNAINNFSNRRSEGASSSAERTSNDNLRLDENGRKIPDPEAEGTNHTQLGTKAGRNGTYRQAREFNSANQEVRDIDFTDHGRPNEHTNPHQHEYSGNGTGNRQRGPAKPLNINRN